MDREKVISEFERWCDEMDDECPVICLDALKLLKEQETIIDRYRKADGFLAAHGWKWKVGE